ncbi:MAG: hypothetical protein ACOY9Y_07075 [Bacillota bacterium]
MHWIGRRIDNTLMGNTKKIGVLYGPVPSGELLRDYLSQKQEIDSCTGMWRGRILGEETALVSLAQCSIGLDEVLRLLITEGVDKVIFLGMAPIEEASGRPVEFMISNEVVIAGVQGDPVVIPVDKKLVDLGLAAAETIAQTWDIRLLAGKLIAPGTPVTVAEGPFCADREAIMVTEACQRFNLPFITIIINPLNFSEENQISAKGFLLIKGIFEGIRDLQR